MPGESDAMDDVKRAWSVVHASFESELSTRGVSPHTLRAYRSDVCELIDWAAGRGRGPGELAYRDLRGYAAALSERGLARASVARKLAAVRSFGEHLVRIGVATQNPAELLPSPKRSSRLPAGPRA